MPSTGPLTGARASRSIQPVDTEHDPAEFSVQERYAPSSICFGCGPANRKGLRIRSFRHGEGLRTVFRPSLEHQAFRGVVNGGVIGTLVDCHGNWTAAIGLMDSSGTDVLPSTVTARFEVRLEKPTPYGQDIVLTSRPTHLVPDAGRVEVEVDVSVNGVLTARGLGLFVVVAEGHPAFHRWQ